MYTVCCLVRNGEQADFLHFQNQSLDAAERNAHFDFYPPEDFPGGFFWFVCPVQEIERLINHHGVLPGNIMAYGPATGLGVALEYGVADFLKEPWDLDELMVRVAYRWRVERYTFSWGNLECDGQRSLLNGVRIDQTPGFHRLVRLLAVNAGRVLSRKHLLLALGVRNPASRLIEVYVALLRKEIAAITGIGCDIITSTYGVGYKMLR